MRFHAIHMKKLLKIWVLLAFLLSAAGCKTQEPVFQDLEPPQTVSDTASPEVTPSAPEEDPSSSYSALRVGDMITVVFSGVTSEQIEPHQERIKADGTLTLAYVGAVSAAGKTAGQLQRELQEKYRKFYKNIVVTVESAARYYYVGGEVRNPGPKPYLGEASVIKAIQTAGGFTEFAKKSRVRLVRTDGTSLIVNCGKAIEDPELDLPIYPGDKIHVPQRFF